MTTRRRDLVHVDDDADDNTLHDDGWNEQARDETPMQRLDRNWADLLQELRVVQTGVQLLTGFLLTLPFQARFEQLSANEKTIYLTTGRTVGGRHRILIAPGSLPRILFRLARTLNSWSPSRIVWQSSVLSYWVPPSSGWCC